MRRQLMISTISLAAAASAGGCGVGDGTGSAKGQLFMLGCLEGDPRGTPDMPVDYDLQPSFFVAEPIEDPLTPPKNRLTIRIARNGNALEITDTLYFTIPDSGQVATCLRGQTSNGVPQWDTTSTGVADSNMTVMGPWCEAPVAVADGGTGLPRIHLVASGPVRSSFTPYGTCVSPMHPPAVVSITGVAEDGWIDFLDFGTAYENSTPPDMRDGVGSDFKIDYGQRLRANFHIVMGDDRVLTARKMLVDPPPDPTIGGTLDGNFDFDLQRGQGAQTFP